MERAERYIHEKLKTKIAEKQFFPTTSLSNQENYRKALECNLIGRKRFVSNSVSEILTDMNSGIEKTKEKVRQIKEAREHTEAVAARNNAVMATTAAWREYRRQRDEAYGIKNAKMRF